MPDRIELPSGCTVDLPLDRLIRFFTEEYAYYDAITSGSADVIEPNDLLVTSAVNARLGAAESIRRIHREIGAACSGRLASIEEDAELETTDLGPLADLLHAAVGCSGVAFAVATKILHRKRRAAIPMLDSVVLNHYAGGPPGGDTPSRFYDKRRARTHAIEILELVRNDLRATRSELDALRGALAAAGFAITRVRILDALLWTEYERRGVYRSLDPEPGAVEALEAGAEAEVD